MPIESYPLDARWRVSARFDAFESPRPVQVPDVRGGTMTFLSLGQLVFRLNDQEHRLTAFGEPGGGEFFVMFKDPTNQTPRTGATESSHRLSSTAVNGRSSTSTSRSTRRVRIHDYTLCPLPPPENRLPVAVEAGLKRLPSAQRLLTVVVIQARDTWLVATNCSTSSATR